MTVDGHPVCAECGTAVAPQDAGQWEHVPDGVPYPRRTRWFSPVTWAELRGMRTYRDFTARYPWTVRPELCGGTITTEEDWAEGTRRLRDYHGQLASARRLRHLRPGENPYLELVHVLAGGPRLAWAALPGGLRNVLDLTAHRKELAAIFAWAIPDEAALAALGQLGPLLECGAGTGYWAAVLSDYGADIVASDLAGVPRSGPPYAGDGSPARNSGHRPWADVLAFDALSAVRAHPDRVLFLCWPPFDEDAVSYAALRAYPGSTLAYIGEGHGGPTGTVRFHRELAANWGIVEQAALPTWPGLRDRLVVYRRNGERRPLAQRDRCPECKRFLPTGAAGRCDRCFTRRPPAMALQVNGHRVEYPQEVVDTMPPGLRMAFERSPSLLWPPSGQRQATA
ncbi:MAG: hypothetical protein JWM19_6134 [Actinomycetia bacterium]|nr:hypothetical protein [Actinomycetes bacterium]